MKKTKVLILICGGQEKCKKKSNDIIEMMANYKQVDYEIRHLFFQYPGITETEVLLKELKESEFKDIFVILPDSYNIKMDTYQISEAIGRTEKHIYITGRAIALEIFIDGLGKSGVYSDIR